MRERWLQRLRVLEAVVELWWARVRVACARSPDLVQVFSQPVPDRVDDTTRAALGAAVGRAVYSARHHCGFSSTCLQRAYAARRMLKRRGVACTVHFALSAPGDRPLTGHVWLSSHGITVTGHRARDPQAVMQTCYGLPERP